MTRNGDAVARDFFNTSPDMAHRPYRYLQLMLVLRNSLLLNAHEYTLPTRRKTG